MKFKSIELKQNTKLLDNLLNKYNEDSSFSSMKSEQVSLGIIEKDTYIGGIIGTIKGNTLHVSLLGVIESFRGKGYGKLLMNEVQKIAENSHCNYLTVNTQDYQGLIFYKKLGFMEIGKLVNCPFEGITKYFLKKDI